MQVDTISLLVEKRYLMHVPRSMRSLKDQWPELKNYQAFKELTAQEMRFVWFMRSAASPFDQLEDEEKLDACIDASFLNEQQRDARRLEYTRDKYPHKIELAFQQMERFNLAARVENYVHILKLRENCKMVIDESMEGKTDEQKDAYMTRAAKAHKILMDTASALEGTALSVSEEGAELMAEHDALAHRLRVHHENRK